MLLSVFNPVNCGVKFHHGLAWRLWCLQCRRLRRRGFDLWIRKNSWRRKWQPAPVFLPGISHGQRSLVGYGPWAHKESDTTEQLNHHRQSPIVWTCCPSAERLHRHHQSSIVWTCCPSAEGYLGCVQFFVIMNKATINTE